MDAYALKGIIGTRERVNEQPIQAKTQKDKIEKFCSAYFKVD